MRTYQGCPLCCPAAHLSLRVKTRAFLSLCVRAWAPLYFFSFFFSLSFSPFRVWWWVCMLGCPGACAVLRCACMCARARDRDGTSWQRLCWFLQRRRPPVVLSVARANTEIPLMWTPRAHHMTCVGVSMCNKAAFKRIVSSTVSYSIDKWAPWCAAFCNEEQSTNVELRHARKRKERFEGITVQ